MSGDIEDRGVVKRYLLGELTDQERERFEVLMMSDTELFNEMLLVEEDLVEAYVNRTMSGNERQRFEHYYMSTAEGREQVSFARAMGKYVESRAAHPPHSTLPGKARRPLFSLATWIRQLAGSPYIRGAAATVIVIVVGLVIWRVFFYQSDLSKGLGLLAYAYRDQRPTEARISGFNYAPAANTRGGEEKVDPVARNRAERILLDEVSEHPSAASHHSLALLYLAEQKFDDAITQFETALKTDPNNALLHSDYGAALLEKGKRDQTNGESEKGLEELAKALDHLTRALELNDNLLEALFNRALCYQYLKLLNRAQEGWHEYLRRDPSSKWAAEARQSLDHLEEQNQKGVQDKEQLFEQFISAYRTADDNGAWTIASQNKEALSGKSIFEQLVAAYLNSALQNQTERANDMLQAVSYLGELESRRGSDSYTSGLAEFYRSLSRTELTELDRARRHMALGKNYYLQAKNSQAIDAYSRAKQIYKQLGDEKEALLADYYIAYSYPDKADIQDSKRLYEEMSRTFKIRNFKWLLMRARLGLSVVSFSLNNCSMAIESASQSLDLAQQMNDANGALNAFSCLIEYYRYVGSHHQALRCVQMSLPYISPSLGIVQIWRHYAIIASAFNSAGFYSAAIDCQQEALMLAQKTNNPATLSVSFAHLGLMYGKAGNSEAAIRNVQLAYEAARSCPDDGVSKSQTAYAALQMGHLYRQSGKLPSALDSYDECIEVYKNLDFPTFLYQAHKGKLICYVAQHNDALASQEIQITLAMAEKYRSTILEAENRNNFFDIEQSVYDLAADFEYSRMSAPEKAFEYSEQSRARSLLDLLSGQVKASARGKTDDRSFQTVSQPLSLATIKQRMPPESQLLQYTVLPNKLLIWVITTDDFFPYEYLIDQNELNQMVRDYLSDISGPARAEARDSSRRARELFGILISGVESHLKKDKKLCIIPDKVLTSIPFASLISDKENADYLIRDYAITYSPSASVFVLCSEQAKEKEGASPERILSIGNPRFDRNRFPWLSDLPSARAEAAVVAACYRPGLSKLLVENDARKGMLESEMGKFEVVHFALHSVLDEKSPMHSKLILAAQRGSASVDDDSAGVLESLEICRLKLPRTRLIVLSACQTGSDRYYGGEGMFSMARSFLEAHVPLAVASLWAVDSDSTKELMISFHKWRRAGNTPTAEALRRAQLAMLDVPGSRYREPYYWASFVAIGGQTSF